MDEATTVLLIEDDPDDVLLFEDLLSEIEEECPTRLVTAETLDEGLQRLGEGDVDIAFVDLSLPGSQGLESFQAVRRLHPSVPVVILTGFTHDSMAGEARRQGALEYLVKGEIASGTLQTLIRGAVT